MFCRSEALSRVVGGAGLDVPSWRSLADTTPLLEPQADRAEARMAAPGCPMPVTTPQETSVAHLVRPCPPVGEITTGSVGFSSTDSITHLPMWPPTRHVWPPLCSVFEGWGVGLQRFSRGVGGCSSFSGGTCGFGSSVTWMLEVSTHWMDSALRSPWTPPCVTPAWRRHCTTARSHHERCGFAGSSQGEGNHIPRTLR